MWCRGFHLVGGSSGSLGGALVFQHKNESAPIIKFNLLFLLAVVKLVQDGGGSARQPCVQVGVKDFEGVVVGGGRGRRVGGEVGETDGGFVQVERLVEVVHGALGIFEPIRHQFSLGVNSRGLSALPVQTNLADGN